MMNTTHMTLSTAKLLLFGADGMVEKKATT